MNPLDRLNPNTYNPPSRPNPPGNGIHAQVAQLVEQRTENPRVGGSIPPLGTINPFNMLFLLSYLCL